MKFPVAIFPLLLLPCALMGETIVSATVNCGSGPVGGNGASSASCASPNGLSADAFVMLSPSSPSIGNDFIEADTLFVNPPPFGEPTASASLDADFVATIHGSTGGGFFQTCLGGGVSATRFGPSELMASLTGASLIIDSSESIPDTCEASLPGGIPFTFGLPFTIQGTFSVSAIGGGNSNVNFLGFDVFDANLNPVPGATFTLVAVPEPHTVPLLIPPLALILLLALRRRAPERGCRERAHI